MDDVSRAFSADEEQNLLRLLRGAEWLAVSEKELVKAHPQMTVTELFSHPAPTDALWRSPDDWVHGYRTVLAEWRELRLGHNATEGVVG